MTEDGFAAPRAAMGELTCWRTGPAACDGAHNGPKGHDSNTGNISTPSIRSSNTYNVAGSTKEVSQRTIQSQSWTPEVQGE